MPTEQVTGVGRTRSGRVLTQTMKFWGFIYRQKGALKEEGGDIISNMWCSSARGNVCVFQQDEQPCFHNNKKHPKVHGEIHTFGV